MCKITEKHLAAHWLDCAVIIKQKIQVTENVVFTVGKFGKN